MRSEVREWLKANTWKAGSGGQEKHDAYDWLIVHVVVPNTAAATQPRIGSASRSTEGLSAADKASASSSSRWNRSGHTTLLEKFRSDFNSTGSGKSGAMDRVAQIRVGINDVPYDMLPRVVPAVPSGYVETPEESAKAWEDLMDKLKAGILGSFDIRVAQYEEDIREKDAQRSLPGWNFCTFFILKEGLARGFESVGLVDDALVVYDELSVGLDAVVHEQAVTAGQNPQAHGGAMLPWTDELRNLAVSARKTILREQGAAQDPDRDGDEDEETVDLQSAQKRASGSSVVSVPLGLDGTGFDDIPISATKKSYRELILANNVSVFDFRCYIFARQVALLLRLGNASSTREELLAKVREQQESVMHGVAPRLPPPKPTDEAENLLMLAEICRRTLEFIPAVSQVLRRDLIASLAEGKERSESEESRDEKLDRIDANVIDNIVASFAFSVAQQILAQTSTKALPIPPSTLVPTGDAHEPKSSIPEPKTMMHPARSSSLHVRAGGQQRSVSPNAAPGADRRPSVPDINDPSSLGGGSQFLKVGLEELAARRAELYTLSRNILEENGRKRGWTDGWDDVPALNEPDVDDMVDVDLDADETSSPAEKGDGATDDTKPIVSTAGVENKLLRAALESEDDFYRLYETLTDKALRHYTVASHFHSVQACIADLGVLKYHLEDYGSAVGYFYRATPFFGERGWSLLELSMLILYSRCLKELKRKEEYAKVLLKLISKGAEAERERLQHRTSLQLGGTKQIAARKRHVESLAMKGYLPELLEAIDAVSVEFKNPLASFFSDVDIVGYPSYQNGADGFSVTIRLQSLLVDPMPIERARVRIVSATASNQKEIWLESREELVLKPGQNRITVHCNANVADTYEVDQMTLSRPNLQLHWERDVNLPPHSTDMFKSPRITLYQRANVLDINMTASRHLQLDRNSHLELELSTGWNTIRSCEIRVRSSTGGLRLLNSEARVVGNAHSFSKPPESGLFCLDDLDRQTRVRIRFPFTIEQDMPAIMVRVEAAYNVVPGDDTGGVEFHFSKSYTIPISLPLGVNVQDIFRHSYLLSRFTVSTASASPLRLFKSELHGCEVFDSKFGVPPGGPVLVFPRQPASLLYKITRRERRSRSSVLHGTLSTNGTVAGNANPTTLYLQLWYSILLDELKAAVGASLTVALTGTPLADLARLVREAVLARLPSALSAQDLERCALLGRLPSSTLRAALVPEENDKRSAVIDWDALLYGVAPIVAPLPVPGDVNGENRPPPTSPPELGPQPVANVVRAFLKSWVAGLPRAGLPIPAATVPPNADAGDGFEGYGGGCCSMLIPVDVPAVAVLHTVDIRIEPPLSGLVDGSSASSSPTSSPAEEPVACVNQLLGAVLRIRWTRLWDTAGLGTGATGHTMEPIEFSYDVTAPSDTWLLGGRKRGRFLVPPPTSSDDTGNDLSSTEETELKVPLLLIPLRDGWLPYPSVEIKEVSAAPSSVSSSDTSVNAASASRSGGGDSHAAARVSQGAASYHQQPPYNHRYQQSHPYPAGSNQLGRGQGQGYGGSASAMPPSVAQTPSHHCETDHRNIGETVRVVADRRRVTLSLDASGPGGGPLVLESERRDGGTAWTERVVV